MCLESDLLKGSWARTAAANNVTLQECQVISWVSFKYSWSCSGAIWPRFRSSEAAVVSTCSSHRMLL